MRHAFVVLLLALTACSDPTTGLMFVIDSDVTPAADTTMLVNIQDTIASSTISTTVEAPLLPLSFLVESQPDNLGPVRVHLDLGPGLAQRSVRVMFIKDELRALPVFLESRCRNVTCGSGLTCIAGQCRDDFVDSTGLPQVNSAGDELAFVPGRPDAGPVDAGPNDAAGTDTGQPDTGPNDAGRPDTGVDAGAPDTGPPDAGYMSCDPFAVNSGCVAPDICREIDGNGYCVLPMGEGMPLGATCTATFTPGGLYQGDNCSPDDNAYCRGALPNDPNGTCVARCRVGEAGFCPSRLSTSECVSESGVEVCLLPAPDSNDYGERCLSRCGDIVCLQSPYWVCSLSCSGAQACPQDFVCRFDLNDSCYLPCQDHPDCREGDTYCSPEGVCVGECSAARPCLAGQSCINDRCV